MKKIVIVGGGFGGIKTALLLGDNPNFDVTLISATPNFEYHAALYRSATGRSPREVVIPLSSIFGAVSNVEIINAEITRIEPQSKKVISQTGSVYNYDHLVLAVGQVSNDFGISGVANNTYKLDTIANTIELREHLKQVVLSSNKKELHFAVVGAGASGVELASELNLFAKDISDKNNTIRHTFHVSLIEASDRILPILDYKISNKVMKRLEKLKVEVVLNQRVKGVTKNSLTLDSGRIAVDTVIWTAGNKNNPLFEKHKHLFHIAENTRVEVDEYLQARQNIYVIGDSSNTVYSGMAYTALRQAKFVAADLESMGTPGPRREYKPSTPIYAVPVGRNYAVFQSSHLKLYGLPAWFLRRYADFQIFDDFQPFADAVYTWRKGNDKAINY